MSGLRLLVGPDVEAGAPLDLPADLTRLYAVPDGATTWLRANMVGTVDGAATGASGTSGSINNSADKQVFDTLRALADAVVVGAGTARTEGYRPAAVPIVLVSRSGEVPETLRGAEPGRVLMATVASSPGLAAVRAQVGDEHVVVAGESEVDHGVLRDALAARGLRQLLTEGGPSLLGAMLAQGVVDELCATVAPALVGGDHRRIVTGPEVDVALRLHTLLESDGTLLARWLVQR